MSSRSTDVAHKQESIADLKEQWKTAQRLRADAAKARAAERSDDVAAKALVEQARTVLSSFYTSNNLMLVEQAQTPPTAAPGQAPLPPPATWEVPYSGKVDESDGIIAILGLISEDLQKDVDTGDAAEQQAIRDHQALRLQITGDTTNLENEIIALKTTKGQKETELQDFLPKQRAPERHLGVYVAQQGYVTDPPLQRGASHEKPIGFAVLLWPRTRRTSR